MRPLDVDGREAFERPFDFSNFPNLQEVGFGVRWLSGSLLWIPVALSTLRLSTSPRLSTIRLYFSRSRTGYRPTGILTSAPGDDLRRVADEVSRIEREFEGAVKVTVIQQPEFQETFDTFDVSFSVSVDGISWVLFGSTSFPRRFFTTWVRWLKPADAVRSSNDFVALDHSVVYQRYPSTVYAVAIPYTRGGTQSTINHNSCKQLYEVARVEREFEGVVDFVVQALE